MLRVFSLVMNKFVSSPSKRSSLDSGTYFYFLRLDLCSYLSLHAYDSDRIPNENIKDHVDS